ncbi:hypothetical protein RRF57_000165 [Xylaria bambusicola]|uniref:Uncharacterized protein n=1 Tax=Xylaria bambusicola TaxID=326684 RepID=A0AAN7UE38_9PEZI
MGSALSLAGVAPLNSSKETGDENSGAKVGLAAPPTVRLRGSQKSMSWSQLGEGDGESDGHDMDDDDEDIVYEAVLSAKERLVGVVQELLALLLMMIGVVTGRPLERLALSEMPFPV